MAKVKIAKKEWYPIIAPKVFQNAVLGETTVYEPQQMLGKGLTINLMSLTNDSKRQNINVNFEVVDVQNGKGLANVVGYGMVQSSIRRLMRRNIERIDMSFSCKTSDNKDLRVKPLLITRSATIGSVVAKIRRTAQDFIAKYIGSASYDSLVNDLVTQKLQSSLRKEINKIYPLRVCEIRSMEIVDLEKKKEARAEAMAKESKGAKEALREAKQSRREESKAAEKKEKKAVKAKEARTESGARTEFGIPQGDTNSVGGKEPKESKGAEEAKEEVQEAEQTA